MKTDGPGQIGTKTELVVGDICASLDRATGSGI